MTDTDQARPEEADGALRAQGVTKYYGKHQVLRAVDVRVRRGEIVGLLGPNGAGKTTTFHIITGFLRPHSGRVFLGSVDITQYPMYRRARMGVGYLSQEPSVFRHLSVADNLDAILQTLPLTRARREERRERLLAELGIMQLRDRRASGLSGGERRRVEIARALCTDPRFMLLDEPFVGIDPITVEEIQRIIQALRAKGMGILITDHNVHETLSITDCAYLLHDGAVLRNGSAEFLVNDPETRKLYLGEKFKLSR